MKHADVSVVLNINCKEILSSYVANMNEMNPIMGLEEKFEARFLESCNSLKSLVTQSIEQVNGLFKID